MPSLKNIYIICASFPVLFILSGFANAESSQRIMEAQIKAENARWAEAYAQGKYAAIGDLYTEGGTLFPPGEGRVIGPKAIAAYFNKKALNGPSRTVSFNSFEFYGDENVVTEISNTEILDSSGNILSRGRQTLVFLKINGAWKLHRDMWNADASKASE